MKHKSWNIDSDKIVSKNDSNNRNNNRLGEELIQQGVISSDQIKIALKEQKKMNQPLGEVLISLGFISEAILRDTLSQLLKKASIDLSLLVPDSEALRLIPKTLSLEFNILPINFEAEKSTLSIAVSDIYNLSILDYIRSEISHHVTLIPLLAGESEIARAIDQFYGHELSVDGILHEIETGEIDYTSLDAGRLETGRGEITHLTAQGKNQGSPYQQPLVRLVDAILADAVKQGASDIHFEPEAGFLRLRYRIDGVLRQIRSLHKDYWLAIVVRLKVVSNMNIAETRAPQDGRIQLSIQGQIISFRVSSFPTIHGENFVLRILDCAKGIVPLHQLGINENALSQLKLMMARPEGIILLTGPTGSGKTTTLYSMLSHRCSTEINIMTLEDPVEYPLGLIRQTSINETLKLDFANGIRALLRQDPDIILVGEIRDTETAEMAIRAAMTGHQVYSTLHTNCAVSSLARLIDMGIKTEMLSGNIIGIVGQRLIRKLCSHCKTQYQASNLEKTILGEDLTKTFHLYAATGCEKCKQTGYKKRIAILEVLKINSELDEMIANKCSIGKFKYYLQQNNFHNLADDACQKVIAGLTSVDEITRVVDLTERLQ